MKKWISPAKLNLFLYITGQREDKYHNLQTLFQFVDFYDVLTFLNRTDNKIHLVTPFEKVIHDENLIIKAAKLLLEFAQTHRINLPRYYGVDIEIIKRLPMGGGLGGGSSNAATTLVALNYIWNLNLSCQQLMELGKKLGSDVAIFIYGHSAFAQGVGDELQSITVPEKWYLIVKPNINIATVSIFSHPDLKRDSVTRNINQLLNAPFKNDCEPIVRKLYPIIDALITWLSSYAPTRLTGTGACVFSECDSFQQAQQLQNRLNDQGLFTDLYTSFIAKGCNRSLLYRAI